MAKLMKIDGVFYFDAEDGSEPVECKTWLETSKKNDAHPEGIWHVKLPKNNVTNRTFVAVSKFEAEAVDGVMTIDVKVGGPRVLGATGVKAEIIKYLDEETANEYTTLVTDAVEAYKAAKANVRRKKPEEMTADELRAYIDALENGKVLTVKEGPKSFLDMFDDAQYNRYNEIIALAQENKANRPKAVRGPLTDEQKAARKIKATESKISKARALLAAMQARLEEIDE
jgi:hypothetical protein